MNQVEPHSCPICSSSNLELVFTYRKPPQGETLFSQIEEGTYFREVKQCKSCEHYINVHQMNPEGLYSEDYVSATYQDKKGVEETFRKIINLPPANSDNVGRVNRIIGYATEFLENNPLKVLDIGSGLGVFPYQLKKQTQWDITALDPDKRATKHIEEAVGVETITADFLKAEVKSNFDLITINKVLEHVADPVSMLSKTKSILKPGGFVYIEVPDGESASKHGKERQEFFIAHPHIFSLCSLEKMAQIAGFKTDRTTRLEEPSKKFTLYSFLKAS